VSVGRFSEGCADLKALESFLRDNILPKVVREFSLSVSSDYAAADPYSGYYPSVGLDCNSWRAKYSVVGTPSAADAKRLEAVIVGFQNKHGRHYFFRPSAGSFIVSVLIFLLVFDVLFILIPPFFVPGNYWTAYWPLHLAFMISAAAAIVYVVWSFRTEDTPPLSFHHSILYMDKEPKNSGFWAVVLTIVLSLVVGLILMIARY
jgi:hypothetical protein